MKKPQQLDLFSSSPDRPAPALPPMARRVALVPRDLDDAALIAALGDVSLGDLSALMAEVGQRKLAAAIPPLDLLCRLYAGFGLHGIVREQAAALSALDKVGGSGAAKVVARLITDDIVQGPTLALAVSVAAHLGVILPDAKAVSLLKHDDPAVRADACRSVRSERHVIATLIDLLDDIHTGVHCAAACALGRMGRPESKSILLRLLRHNPTAESIEAIARVADDDSIVLLKRILSLHPTLTDAVRDALEVAAAE